MGEFEKWGYVWRGGGGGRSRGVRVGGGYEGGGVRGGVCCVCVCGGGVRVVRWDGVRGGYVRREGLGVRVGGGGGGVQGGGGGGGTSLGGG